MSYQIGNYVKSGNRVYEVTCITKNGLEKIETNGMEYLAKCAVINPIPITEEWLLDFGFLIAFKSFQDTLFEKDGTYFWLNDDDKSQNGFKHEGIGAIINCSYVHQLQNIYFYLTGNKLIKND